MAVSARYQPKLADEGLQFSRRLRSFDPSCRVCKARYVGNTHDQAIDVEIAILCKIPSQLELYSGAALHPFFPTHFWYNGSGDEYGSILQPAICLFSFAFCKERLEKFRCVIAIFDHEDMRIIHMTTVDS